jgi:hypothetical protein
MLENLRQSLEDLFQSNTAILPQRPSGIVDRPPHPSHFMPNQYPDQMLSEEQSRPLFKHVSQEELKAVGIDSAMLRKIAYNAQYLVAEQIHFGTSSIEMGSEQLLQLVAKNMLAKAIDFRKADV